MKLKDYIAQDKRMEYYPFWSKERFLDWLLKTEQYHLRLYVSYLRSEEYYTFIHPNKLLKYWYFRKKNKLGAKLGFFIPAGCFGPDLKVAHYGSIIVNPHSKVGSGCTIHGNCCLGNRGGEVSENDSPILGKNINIGQNAQILGPVQLGDNITIGAGSIVTRSFEETGITIVGTPAKKNLTR